MAKTLKEYSKDWDFMDTKDFYPPINKKNLPIAFFSIISLFSEDANFNLKQCYVNCDKLFVSGYSNGKRNELMLRYNLGVEKFICHGRI